MPDFLKPKGDCRNLKVYRKTECIYDITYHFAHRYLERSDRTVDQMIQAARSGKQNIAEGRSAGNTSTETETEIKLMNVAKASLQELLADYEDYLRARKLGQWGVAHPRFARLRELCQSTNDASYYSALVGRLDDTETANLAICLIHQADAMLFRLIKLIKQDFLKNGGIKEAMYRARLEARKNIKT